MFFRSFELPEIVQSQIASFSKTETNKQTSKQKSAHWNNQLLILFDETLVLPLFALFVFIIATNSRKLCTTESLVQCIIELNFLEFPWRIRNERTKRRKSTVAENSINKPLCICRNFQFTETIEHRSLLNYENNRIFPFSNYYFIMSAIFSVLQSFPFSYDTKSIWVYKNEMITHSEIARDW